MRPASTEPGFERSSGRSIRGSAACHPTSSCGPCSSSSGSCVNAGFRAVIVVSGQNGAQGDLRLVADEFMKLVPVPVVVRSDPELVHGTFPGDHAGRYELSQLLYIRPDLVDLSRVSRVATDPLGRFAQNPDAGEATADYGRAVIEAQIDRIGELRAHAGAGRPDLPFLSFDDVEPAWAAIEQQRSSWVSFGDVSG